MKPAVFFDRDGVLNIDYGYIYKEKDFIWIDGAIKTVKYFRDKGYFIFVVTNQSGISRGYYTEQDVINLHNFINNELKNFYTKIDRFYFSPYHPEFHDKFPNMSNSRKPNTGMLEMALSDYNFDISNSLLIGDNESDMQCAKKFGIKGYLFNENNLLNFVKKNNL